MKSILLFFLLVIFILPAPAPTFASHIIPAPVKTFTASVEKTIPGQAVTISWTTQNVSGVNVSGVNIQINCSNYFFVTSPSYNGNLPCERPVFSSLLGNNGSLALNFSNSSPDDKPFTILLLPSFDGTTYDAPHGKSLALTIASDILPDPVINSFNASSTNVASGNSLTISWSALYTKGVNIKISCNSSITAATSSAEAAPALPCDSYVFTPALPQNGTRTFFFRTTSNYSENITLTITPTLQSGGYDLTKRRTLSINVVPPTVSATPPMLATATPGTTPPTPAAPPTATTPVAPMPVAAPKMPAAPAKSITPLPTPTPTIKTPVDPQKTPTKAEPELTTPKISPQKEVEPAIEVSQQEHPQQIKKPSFFRRIFNFIKLLFSPAL